MFKEIRVRSSNNVLKTTFSGTETCKYVFNLLTSDNNCKMIKSKNDSTIILKIIEDVVLTLPNIRMFFWKDDIVCMDN